MQKERPDFHFEVSEFEMMRVDCMSNLPTGKHMKYEEKNNKKQGTICSVFIHLSLQFNPMVPLYHWPELNVVRYIFYWHQSSIHFLVDLYRNKQVLPAFANSKLSGVFFVVVVVVSTRKIIKNN